MSHGFDKATFMAMHAYPMSKAKQHANPTSEPMHDQAQQIMQAHKPYQFIMVATSLRHIFSPNKISHYHPSHFYPTRSDKVWHPGFSLRLAGLGQLSNIQKYKSVCIMIFMGGKWWLRGSCTFVY